MHTTIEATVSLLETMPEEARIKVLEFTQQLFVPQKSSNPFAPVSAEQVLSDLTESRRQIADGKGQDMAEALNQLGRQHGFI